MILTPDNEYAAVLDACVLIPMPLCDTLLRLAEEPAMYRPFWSERILQEVGTNLQKKLGISKEQAEYRIARMREAFPEAEVRVPEELCNALDCIPDKDDRHVLAAAIRAGAHAIVTQNVKHFPQECLDKFAVLCQTPDDFLVHQFHLCPDQLMDKLDAQAAAIQQDRPAVTQRLAKMTPQFAALVEERTA